MTFAAAMRVGSLEILGALVLFGVISARMRSGASAGRPKAVTLAFAVREGAARTGARETTLELREGTPAVIGRSSQADLEVSDPEVSRRHARLDLVRGVVYLADLGSSNGTFLNGKALSDESIEVRPGDDVDVGNTRITLLRMDSAV